MKALFSKVYNKLRGLELWVIALIVVTIMLVVFAAQGYLGRWLGSIGQVATGAVIGWVISRRLLKLNVSEYAEPLHRCLAGLGQCIVIAAGMIGVAVAV